MECWRSMSAIASGMNIESLYGGGGDREGSDAESVGRTCAVPV